MTTDTQDAPAELDLSSIPDAPKTPSLKDVYEAMAPNDPAQAAQVQTLAQQTGQHPSFVANNLPAATKAAAMPTDDAFAEIEKNHPIATAFLKQQANMAKSHDDIANIAAHEDTNQKMLKAHGLAEAIEAGLQNSISGLEFRGKNPSLAVSPDDSFLNTFASQTAQFAGDYPTMVGAGLLGGMAASELGPVGSGVAAGVAAFAFPDALREALREHYDSGDADSAVDLLKKAYGIGAMKAGLKGAVVGLATGGTEVGLAVKGFGKLAQSAGGLAAMTVTGPALEGRLPTASGAASNALLAIALHKGGQLGKYGLDRTFPKRVADIVRLEATLDAADLLDKNSRASKLRERDPKAFKDLMNKFPAARVPVAAYESLFQAAGVNPEKVSNDLGVATSHNEARKTNGHVVIPQGEWTSKEMDPYRSKFRDHIVFDPSHLTATEQADSDKLVKERITQTMAASDAAIKADASRQEAFKNVQEKHEALLLSAGLSEKEAKANSKIVAAHYTVEAMRRAQGQTAQQLYEAESASVQRGLGEYQEKGRPEVLRQDQPIALPNPGIADASYSKLLQTLDQKIQGKTATVEQIKALASNFKEDERKWTGFDKFMEGKSGKIEKSDLIDFLNNNRFQVEERATGEKLKPETPEDKTLATTGEPTEADFRAWASGDGDWSEQNIQNAIRRHANGESSQMYADFLESRRVAAGGLPSVDDLSDEELEEKVREQHDERIIELANEKESESIDRWLDDNPNEWKVNVEANTQEAQDIDDINEEDGKWRVDFDHGGSKIYDAENEDDARAQAESDLSQGKIEDNENGYKLTLDGNDYEGTKYDSATRSRKKVQTWFDSEKEAEDAAEEASDNELDKARENMYGNTDGSERQEALNEIVEEVRNGDLELEGYENGSGKSKTPAKKEFKWGPAKWPSTGSYTTTGAILGTEQEVVFHTPALEKFPSDENHFKSLSEQRIGWMRTSLHKNDSNSVVRLADENQNDRTQKGAAEGYQGDASEAAHETWARERETLQVAQSKAKQNHEELYDGLNEGYNNSANLQAQYPSTHVSFEDWFYGRNGSYTSAFPLPSNSAMIAEERAEYDAKVKENRPSVTQEFGGSKYLAAHGGLKASAEAKDAAAKALTEHDAKEPKKGTVPDTPFKNNWQEFQWKRFLRWHFEGEYKTWQKSGSTLPFTEWWDKNGIKQVAWTTGMQQAERNNRAHDVDKLVYDPVKQELSAFKDGRKVVDASKMAPDAIAERLGNSPQAQDIVKRLLATEPVKASPVSEMDTEVDARDKELKEKPFKIKQQYGPESKHWVFRIDGHDNVNDESPLYSKDDYNEVQAAAEAQNYFRRAGFDPLSPDERKEAQGIAEFRTKRDQDTEHLGSHVIHDEGGIKVAANAKFYTDLYDVKIMSFLKKFGKQWGATVGESMLATGEQLGRNRYEGDEPGLFKLEKLGREIAGSGNEAGKVAIRNVLESMKAGSKFSEAIAQGADLSGGSEYHRLAEQFGGRLVKDKAVRHEKFHALNLTKEMANAAITQGFPLFQGEGNDPNGEYIPQLNEIRLGMKTDASTYMHEFFHGALKHMFDFVKSGQATEDYLAHFKGIADFLDIKDDQTKLTTEQQEKGARAFERYLRGEDTQEGGTKAPSVELRGAFSDFRRWLTQVYRQIKGSPIEGGLSAGAHDFFDRMLATEDQIEAAANDSGYQPSEIQALPEGDPAQQNRVRTMQERAHEKAVDILLKEQMADLRDENKAVLAKERERLTGEITPKVSEMPVHRAAADLEDAFGSKQIPADLAKGFIEGKANESEQAKFEAIAEINGFQDGRDMAQQIADAWQTGGAPGEVKRRVDEGMKAYDTQDPVKMRAAAIEAIHNAQSSELLALEAQILEDMQHKKEVGDEVTARRRTSRSLELAQIKQQVRDTMAAKPVGEAGAFRPYVTAERKAAVRVSEALAKEDYEGAAKAKREQLMNHALAAEAMRNQKEINKTGKFLTKFIKRGSDMLNMPQGFVGKIDDLLESRGLKAPRDPAQDQTLLRIAQQMQDGKSSPSEIANATGYVQGDHGWQREKLPDFIARINDENYVALSLPDSVMRDSLKQTGVNPGMTMAEMRDLKTAIKMLNFVGTKFETFLSGFIKGDLKTNAGELARTIKENIGTPHGNGPLFGTPDLSHLQKAVDFIKSQPDGMIASKVNLLTLCEYLDKLDPNGPAKNNIYRPLRSATNNEKEMRAEAADRLNEIREKHYTPAELAKFDESIATWQVNGKPVKLTKENALILLLNRGSESNLDRITRGFNLTPEQVQGYTDLLDKRDHDFAQDVWKFVDTFWPKSAELEMRVNGIEPTKVKAIPVKSAHGTYEGGYFPLSYDYEKSADAYKNAEQRNALFKQYSPASAQTEQGMLKERVKTLARPVRLDFGGLFNHLDDVIHDITFRPAVIDVARFLNMPEAKTAIVNAIGIEGYKKIGDDLKAAASSQSEFMTPTDKKLQWFRFGATMSTLGYRLVIFPRRISEDVVNSMREVGAMNTIGAVGDFVKTPQAMMEFNRDNSVVMRDRAINRERDLIQMAQQWKGKDSWLRRFAFMQDTVADQALSHPIWNAVYKNNLEKNGHDRAVQLADEAILKTFGGGDEIDRVGAQRGGELNRLLSMYYSWHSMMFNRAWLQGKIAGLEYNDGNYGKATAIIASTVATSWIIPAAIDIFWKELFRNPTEGEDDERRKHRMAAAALETPFAYFPLARNIAAAGIPRLLGEKGQGYHLSPAEDALENLVNTSADLVRTPFDPDKHYDEKFLDESLRSAALLLRTPAQLNTWTTNFVSWMNNEGEATWRDILSRRVKK